MHRHAQLRTVHCTLPNTEPWQPPAYARPSQAVTRDRKVRRSASSVLQERHARLELYPLPTEVSCVHFPWIRSGASAGYAPQLLPSLTLCVAPTCPNCSAGQFCEEGSSAPFACTPGTWSNVTSLASGEHCLGCPSGHFCGAGAAVPTPCPANTHGDGQVVVVAWHEWLESSY